MSEMIINPNGFFEIEDYEVNWTLNDEETEYDQILEAAKGKCGNIYCSNNDHIVETFGEVEFLIDFSAEIMQNKAGKYVVVYGFDAEPVNYICESDYEEAGLDYMSVAREICDDLKKQGYVIDIKDCYTDMHDYDGSRCEYFNAEFDTAQEALSHVKDFLAESLRWLEAKGVLYTTLQERMDEAE